MGPAPAGRRPEKLAKILFSYDNPPGTREISGSQDTIGIVYPGLNKANYTGEYWPARIESVQDEKTLRFIEQALYLIPLGPRHQGLRRVERDTTSTRDGAKALSDAAEGCWDAILAPRSAPFWLPFRESFEAQIAMFPHMMNSTLAKMIAEYPGPGLGLESVGRRRGRLPDPGGGPPHRKCGAHLYPAQERLNIRVSKSRK